MATISITRDVKLTAEDGIKLGKALPTNKHKELMSKNNRGSKENYKLRGTPNWMKRAVKQY